MWDGLTDDVFLKVNFKLIKSVFMELWLTQQLVVHDTCTVMLVFC